MTTYTGPLNVKELDAETTVVSIGTSGQATFGKGTLTINADGTVAPAGLSGLTIVNAVTSAVGVTAADNTGAEAVPASANTYLECTVNGNTYMIALFTKKT